MPYRQTVFFVIFVCKSIIEGETADSCPNGWVSYEESCYLFNSSSPVHFTEAERYCRQRGGHLVTVESSGENTFIKDFLRRLTGSAGRDYWMGLSDGIKEGNWKWLSNGAAPTYTNWGPGEPNDNFNQDCVQFWHRINYSWDDALCTENNLPLCEKSRTATGIIG